METSEQIERFRDFFESYKERIHEVIARGWKSVVFEFSEVLTHDPELADLLLEDPENLLKAAELSLNNLDLPSDFIKIRFRNLPSTNIFRIRDLRSIHLDRFLAIEGLVRQTSDVRPQVTSAKFECPSCGNTMLLLQIDTQFREPSRCSCGRKGKFRLIHKDLIDAQRIVLEEAPETLEGGEQPKRLAVFLKGDLVDPKMEKRATPGTKVKITGVVKEVAMPLRTGGHSTRYDIVMESNYIEPIEETFEEINVSKEEEEEILKAANDSKIYQRMIMSIAPSIYGHEDIKAALVLQLMGGVQKVHNDGTKRRGDAHVLLIGDPGSGKSQMLQFISKIAPKARLVSGKGASSAGLTAAVVKDEFMRGWALEAGAFVLANGGFAIIDEMDKINSEDTSALHQALEQQIITISKANIQACYSSDTEVLTEDGWRKYAQVGDLKIAQFNPNDQIIKFIPHKGLSVYDYNGEMYQFKNKRNDIFVTPDHKMLAREYRHKKYEIYEAKDLAYNYIQFLNSGKFIGSKDNYFFLPAIKHKQNRKDPKYTHQNKIKKIKMELWLEFLGYYLSEGGIQKKPTIGISQKPGDNLRKIKKCLSSLAKCVGFTLSETKDGIYTRFQITNTQLFEFLEKHCGRICKEKKYPLNFSSLSVEQLKVLYDAMMLGDGCSKGKYFSSISKDLIDLFQAIAFLVGKSANKSLHYKGKDRGNREDCYRVSLSDKTKPTIRKKKIRIIDYKGKVFCFSTSTGFFVTRRNGKIAIQGNTLKAQTTLLAAANPKLGRFDPYLPIASQINMPATLINRFDLIFPIRDIPSREFDTRVATHVLMLQQKPEDIKAEFTPEFLKKYISYARQKIKPELTKEAVDEIKDFYVNLRNLPSLSEQELKPIPISARQLEALVRLAEGSARVRLSKKVTKKDAQRAIETLKRCLMQVGFDPESGQIDIDRISTGIPTSQRSKIVKIQALINELTKKVGKRIPVDDIILEAAEQGITEDQVNEALELLKRDGTIYQPQPNIIEKI